MTKYTISLILIGLIIGGSVAQNASQTQTFTVRGKITDENGDPLPGANIMIPGTAKGASTNPMATMQSPAFLREPTNSKSR
jgi:hypothetical protein